MKLTTRRELNRMAGKPEPLRGWDKHNAFKARIEAACAESDREATNKAAPAAWGNATREPTGETL